VASFTRCRVLPLWFGMRATFLLLLILCVVHTSAQQLKKRKEVSIGYNLNYNPWKLAINKGVFEKVTGYTIKWTEIKDTSKAIVAMANKEVQMVVANSVDIARAFSRRLECRLIWVVEDTHNAEALIVHNRYHAVNGAEYGGDVANPLDLRGKVIAVWFGSTMHYALHSFYSEMQVTIVESTVYQRLGCRVDATYGQLKPCYYLDDPMSVMFLSMMPGDIVEKWGLPDNFGSSHRRLLSGGCATYPDIATCYPHQFQAAYVGFPYTIPFQKTGQVLITNAMLNKWGKMTFTGLLADTDFLYELDPKYATYKVKDFVKVFIDEMAKANYYYHNNTKEFGLSYAAKLSVASKVASVIGGKAADVQPHLKLFRYLTPTQQATCDWLGCGNISMVAWSLMDQSLFLQKVVKLDWNPSPIVYGTSPVPLVEYQLSETIQHYDEYIDASYIDENLAEGKTGSNELIPGETVYLGYQTTANYGRTINLIAT